MPTTPVIHCNTCGTKTKHAVLHEERNERSQTLSLGTVFEQSALYEMLQCRGCDSITMRRTYRSSYGNEPPDVEIDHYPPRISRRAPYWANNTLQIFDLEFEAHENFPIEVRTLMAEVYIAVQNGSRRLAAMGVRATLEHVMINKISDQGNFGANLDEFQKEGYLSLKQGMALDAILEAGHAAAHRGWEPSDEDLNTLLDITESVIESVYLHGYQTRLLEKKVPKRPPRKEKTK